MLYYSKKSTSKVVHFESCAYKKAIGEKRLGSFETFKEAKRNGYHLCQFCNPVIQCYRNEERKVRHYCGEKGLVCYMKDGFLEIKSVHSQSMTPPEFR